MNDDKASLTLPDGKRFEGELRDGLPHGAGIVTSPDGTRYEGEFREGKMHGQGVVSHPDGIRYAGEFRDGEPMGFLNGMLNHARGIGSRSSWRGKGKGKRKPRPSRKGRRK